MKDKFIKALNNIINPELKDLALYCLNKLPEHFWTQPSSSTGKHHPEDEHSVGGLALHTLRVMEIAEILIEASAPEPYYMDAVRLAAMFHDAGRYGLDPLPTSHSLDNHPVLSAKFLNDYALLSSIKPGPNIRVIGVTYHAILSHMGKWGKLKPVTQEDWIVHYSDVIASHYFPRGNQ